MSESELAIDLSDVAKTYRGKVEALCGISMQVHRGAVFGLLGPNGAGKSTLVKILMTVVRPTRCTGTMLGRPVGHKATLAHVGYLPEHHRFADYLTGAQVLDFHGALTSMTRSERKRRSGELLDIVGMTEWAGSRVGKYSKGMRQRLGIANALISDPDLVILDEPTDGVDPVGRRDIRSVLVRLKDEGKTVFLNSHLLSELELICDRVAILVQGQVSSQGTIEDLTEDDQRIDIRVDLDGSDAERTITSSLSAVTCSSEDGRCLPEGPSVKVMGRVVRVATTDARQVQPLLVQLLADGLVVEAVTPHRPSLEDLFMRAVTDPTTGDISKPGAAGNGARP